MLHLHLHTVYSLRDSLVKIDESFIEKLHKIKVSSVAITDHGNISGWVSFNNLCVSNNIKPIFGTEAYVVDEKDTKTRYHVVMLAQNDKGIENIIKLNNKAYIDNFYFLPILYPKDFTKETVEGIIFLSGCIKSIIYLPSFDDIFNIIADNFYLEIMFHNFKEQKKHNLEVINFANQRGLPIVITQDVHYLNKEDHEYHGLLMELSKRNRYEGNTYHMCSWNDVMKMYEDHTYIEKKDLFKIINTTYEVANKCYASLKGVTYDNNS